MENEIKTKSQKGREGRKGKTGREGRGKRKGSDERDGITARRKTWQGKAIDALEAVGTETGKQWFTHRALREAIANHAGGLPGNLADVLYKLIKGGYIERACKPNQLPGQQNYVYRRTGKAFKEQSLMDDIGKGLHIRFDYPRHEKWFRDMMIY